MQLQADAGVCSGDPWAILSDKQVAAWALLLSSSWQPPGWLMVLAALMPSEVPLRRGHGPEAQTWEEDSDLGAGAPACS